VKHDLGYGNRVVHIPAGPETPLGKREQMQHIGEFVDGVRSFAAEKGVRYDIIHSHYWLSGLAAETLSDGWGGIPIVHMFHTLGEMKNRVARQDEAREPDERLEAERRLTKRADRITVATLAELTQLRFLYQADDRHLRVIPPGVDTSHFYPIPSDEAREFIGLKAADRMLLFVGRIEVLKGVDTLIRATACEQLTQLMPRGHLAIIGGEPDASPEHMTAEMARLRRLCAELGLKDTVVFLGKRSQDTLPYYYSAAEAVIMPSHYESFGMVALESMACGTPVIASEVGGLAYLVQDGRTGFTIPDGDPEALCRSLAALLGNERLRAEMGANAAAYAREYSWEKIVVQILDVYGELTAVEA
jgi:D-inositol-3-phosphate glycosyltransferase